MKKKTSRKEEVNEEKKRKRRRKRKGERKESVAAFEIYMKSCFPTPLVLLLVFSSIFSFFFPSSLFLRLLCVLSLMQSSPFSLASVFIYFFRFSYFFLFSFLLPFFSLVHTIFVFVAFLSLSFFCFVFLFSIFL